MYHFVERSLSTGCVREFERDSFPDEIKPLLCTFVECAHALNDTKFVRKWDQIEISIQTTPDGRVSDLGSLPSDEAIAAFLHRLRPFYLSKEPTYFNYIANIVSKHLNDPFFTNLIRHYKRFYNGRASVELFKIEVDGMIINSEEFLDHYLNSLEYHRDPDRRRHIDRVARYLPLDAQKPIIVFLLQLRLNAINKLSSFLLTCFAREDGRPFDIEVP